MPVIANVLLTNQCDQWHVTSSKQRFVILDSSLMLQVSPWDATSLTLVRNGMRADHTQSLSLLHGSLQLN